MSTLYLETWLHNIIRSRLQTDEAFRRFTGKNNLSQIARSDVETYQIFMLRQALQYAYENSSFYRELFSKHGIRPEDFSCPGDFSGFPFTEASHLAESPYRLLCTSQSEIARPYTFVTSGTTGPQKKIFWTQGDLDRIIDFMAAGIATVATPTDVIQILLPDGRPNSQADLLSKGVRKLGATPVAASIDLRAEEQLKLIEDLNSTILFGYTSQIFRLSKELQANHDLAGKGVRFLFLAAEYLPNTMRRELQTIWNCPVHTHYGLTEMGLGVAVECSARDGYHFNEADLLLEIVNPKTGEVVDPGVEGELVFTTLNRQAMPLIRYRTHDLSRMIVASCPCGAATLLKIDKVRKRLENIVVLGNGAELYPALLDDVLFEIEDLIDYQVVLTRHEDADRLSFTIETAREQATVTQEILNKLLSMPAIADNVRIGKMIKPEVQIVGWGALQSVTRAKKMIVDNR